MNERFVPRCPVCREPLDEHARYASVPVFPADDQAGAPMLRLPVVYCDRCGTAIGALGTAVPPPLLPGRPSTVPDDVGRPAPAGEGTRRPPPMRHFPATVETVGLSELPAGSRVELHYRDRRILEGGIGEAAVSLQVAALPFGGSADGYVGEKNLTVAWDTTRKSPGSPDFTVGVEGTFADEPVDLRAGFHFEPDAWLHHGDVAGNLAGIALRAHVEPAGGGFDTPATVAVDGLLDEATFSVFASVTADRTRGAVRGSVDGRPLVLDARQPGDGPDRAASEPALRVTGAFEGSTAVLLLAIGALLQSH